MDTVIDGLLASLSFPASGYWPWWLGALGLTVVALGFSLSLGRPFGVSTMFARVLDPARELAADRARAEASGPPASAQAPSARSSTPTDTWLAQLVFVVAVAVGGGLAAALSGRWGTTSYGALYESLLAPGWLGVGALVVGGFFVGFGTQMSGGCTSGHGLVGCSRASPPSLLATATFFGTGMAVSFLLAELAR